MLEIVFLKCLFLDMNCIFEKICLNRIINKLIKLYFVFMLVFCLSI